MFGSRSRGRWPRSTVAVPLALILAATGASADIVPGRWSLESDAPAGLLTALDKVLEMIVTGTEYGAALGAVLSVAGPGWRYVGAAGMADPDAGDPVDCTMPFQIGSNTRMMTAAVLLRLHEKGRLSLDDPLPRQLPEVAERLRYGQQSTLRQPVQHTAGVFSHTDTAPRTARPASPSPP